MTRGDERFRPGHAVDDGEARIDAGAVARVDAAVHGRGESEAKVESGLAVKSGDVAFRLDYASYA